MSENQTTRYHGSCHCGQVRFAADINLSAGTGKCNCTLCWKTRRWAVIVRPPAFEAIAGADGLSGGERGGFCRGCGVAPYSIVDTTGWGWGDGGDVVSVNLACLDDLDPAELIAAPINYSNGRDDDWWHAPAEVRHL